MGRVALDTLIGAASLAGIVSIIVMISWVAKDPRRLELVFLFVVVPLACWLAGLLIRSIWQWWRRERARLTSPR